MIERMVEERLRQWLESSTTKNEATVRIKETFDTSQPIDSVTGTPPLQRRVTERSESQEKNDARIQRLATTSARIETDICTETDLTTNVAVSDREDNSFDNAVINSEEQKGNKTLVFLQVAADCMIAIFMLWLLLTVGRAIKQF